MPEIRRRLAAQEAALTEDGRAALPAWARLVEGAFGLSGAIAVASLWWVSRDMTALAVEAANGPLPETPPPYPSGIVLFAGGLPRSMSVCPNPATGGVDQVELSPDGLVWAGSRLAWLVSDPETLAAAPDRSLPVGIPHMVPVGEAAADVLRAVWALSAEPRVCDASEERIASVRGDGRPGPVSRVKVVNLRENVRSPWGDGDGAGDAPRYSHRFVVRGFWRNQVHGPRNSLRRRQWIPPYVKGPADTPLVVKDTVLAWRR